MVEIGANFQFSASTVPAILVLGGLFLIVLGWLGGIAGVGGWWMGPLGVLLIIVGVALFLRGSDSE